MSNRIAASRMTDRVELSVPTSGWAGLLAAAQDWLGAALVRPSGFALSSRMRRDLGLADILTARDATLDFEARRLGF